MDKKFLAFAFPQRRQIFIAIPFGIFDGLDRGFDRRTQLVVVRVDLPKRVSRAVGHFVSPA
jgi:hypothetical protein